MSKIEIKIPIVKSDIIEDGKRVVEYGEQPMLLDMSLVAQMRWEQKFPVNAEKEDLESYTERISKNKKVSSAVIISKLKTIYCYLDTNISFIEFLEMFDLTQADYVEKLTDAFKNAFEIILGSSSEKN